MVQMLCPIRGASEKVSTITVTVMANTFDYSVPVPMWNDYFLGLGIGSREAILGRCFLPYIRTWRLALRPPSTLL
jgi:hypothetical protein